jgi:hypothetical protein
MEKFNQLCVWPGTSLDGNTPQDLVNFFKDELNARVQFEQTVLTNPDLDENGNIIKDTGGRCDLFFYIHDDDISHFAIPRLKLGIRWWEDVVSYNNGSHLYSKEILEKYLIKW